MRAIILAAGQGTRLRPLTDDRPKCMVELEGKPLLEHQLEVLRSAGVDDIHVVGGYRAEWLQRPDITLHINKRFDQTNMVATLFAAESIMDGSEDLIIAYGDIVYEPRALQALLECDAPVCLTVDRAWRRYWEARMDDPLADAETLKLTDSNRVTELGKKPTGYEDIQGQYMGLVKIRADYVSQIPAVWRAMDRDATYDGKDYDNMYMTSFLQHLIDSGWEARAAFVENGWAEIDSPLDLRVATHFWTPS
ncbi:MULTISPECIES: NTP transferase domain-containing protein [Halorhodospira]|uniref:phosphocholine cytidylyltransferase family protein n=1 Tax=Halorhodospira TaxID=85108 RepID=UPI001EE81153|nr:MULTISPECIES: phosphocholine cytidylyltransferase family protein [Halorhodospira]MCG5528871.1 phosphocholine cytidylyltransferase family protein [Halorhodospira halophila]MCG5544257.1 phosphocholine cytidylyltransferase family protein [Halorhodospira sp. 9628]